MSARVTWKNGVNFPAYNAVNHNGIFSYRPRMSMRQAFMFASRGLEDGAVVEFTKSDGLVSVWIQPQADAKKPLLIYTHYPQFNSVRINHIHAGPEKHRGIGKSLLKSQMEFWDVLGVQSVCARTHDSAIGFYEKIGFRRVKESPEHAEIVLPDPLYVRAQLSDLKL